MNRTQVELLTDAIDSIEDGTYIHDGPDQVYQAAINRGCDEAVAKLGRAIVRLVARAAPGFL